MNHEEARKGTELHDIAARLISMGIKLPRTKQTLNMYVNDAIGYRMTPEQPLVYSRNCFGTADAIKFDKDLLRVHDLKNGVSPCSMRQLEIYAAIFCLEYGIPPGTIDMELRIYKNDDVETHYPTVDAIAHIMDKIITFDKMIEKLR